MSYIMQNRNVTIDLNNTQMAQLSSARFLLEAIAMQQKHDKDGFVDQVDEERLLKAFFESVVYCPLPRNGEEEKNIVDMDSRGPFDTVNKALPWFTSLVSLYGVYSLEKYDYDCLSVMELLAIEGDDDKVSYVFMPGSLDYFMTKGQLRDLHERYLEIVGKNNETGDFLLNAFRLETFPLLGPEDQLLDPYIHGIEFLNTVTIICMETGGDVDTIIISQDWLDSYSITWEEAYAKAKENVFNECCPKWFMVDAEFNQIGERYELSDAPDTLDAGEYYAIFFGDAKYNKGAGYFYCDFAKWIAQKTQTDLYIFPQRDGIYAIPCDETIYECAEELNITLRYMNADNPSYGVSSHGYYYSLKDDDMYIVETELKKKSD